MRILKSWFLCLPLFLLLPACPGPQSSCSQDSECSAEATCNKEVGVCVTCEAGACSDFQQCLRGSCGARYRSITIKRPTGGVISPVARLQAQLDLSAGAARNDPPFLTYVITDSSGAGAGSGQLALLRDGLYEATWNAGSSSNYTLVVTYEAAGLTSAPAQFTIDAQPPTVEIAVPIPVRRDASDPTKADERDPAPLFDTAWRRSEIVNVSIKASEPLDLGNSTLVLTASGTDVAVAAPRSLTVASGCGAPFCATAAIDLAEPPMLAFRTTFGLRLAATDLAGNGAQASGAIRVTRQKWRFTTGGDVVTSTPAIGVNGNIYLGSSSASNSLFAINPQGIRQWAAPVAVGPVQGSLAVSKSAGAIERLFYASLVGGNIVVNARNTIDGSIAAAGDCITIGNLAEGSGAMALTSGAESFVTVVQNGGTATLLAFRFDQADETERCKRSTGLRGINYPGNVAAAGTDVFFGDEQGSLQSFALGNAWSARAGWPIANVEARSITLNTSDIVGVIGDGLARGRGFAVTKAGVSVDSIFPAGAGLLDPGWGVALGPNNRLLFSREAPSAVLVESRQPNVVKELSTPSNFMAAPIFGQGGLIYVADEQGGLSSYDANLNLQWRAILGASIYRASPNIDCARDAAGSPIPGRPGVVYAAANDGTLDAIIVDSKGIDTTAPWPKYQHDPRNSGNSSTSLSEFACP